MFSFVLLIWLALQLPIGAALGHCIACPQKSAAPVKARHLPKANIARAA
jgi:hypothetical protein